MEIAPPQKLHHVDDNEIEEGAKMILSMIDHFTKAETSLPTRRPPGKPKQTKKRQANNNLVLENIKNGLVNDNVVKRRRSATKKVNKLKQDFVQIGSEEEKDDNDDDDEEEDNGQCPICKKAYRDNLMVCCDSCNLWAHIECDSISESEYSSIPKNSEYVCPKCRGDGTKFIQKIKKK